MIKVTFIPKKRCSFMSNVEYLIDQSHYTVAVQLAKMKFIREHKYKFYDKLVISHPRVIEG